MKLILPDMFCGTWIAQTSQVKVSKRFKRNPKSEGCKSRHLAACILKNQSQLICCAWQIIEPTAKFGSDTYSIIFPSKMGRNQNKQDLCLYPL